MLSLNIVTEFRTIFRNYWLASITILLLSLCLYAGNNGYQHVTQRQANISAALTEMEASDRLVAARLDSIDKGLEISLPSWQAPNSPTATGDRSPRVAAFEAGELSLIATGQSDMFNHYVKPTLTGDNFSIAFTELTSPVTLLMGNFDPAFVLVYLLPLVIISFSYNILSREKEQGSLVLIASSPMNLKLWLLQKVMIRFVIVAILLSLCLLLMLSLNGSGLGIDTFRFLLAVWLYAAFWFSLAFLINLRGWSSAKNAIVMLGLWVTLVLAIPSLISQTANAFYPMPSRALLINEMRTLQAELDKEQDKILDNYLRNHPELITRDADESTAYGWWQRYFASKDMVIQEMTPLLNSYDQSLKQQQDWVDRLSFLSPAVLLQNSLNHLSQTSTAHYSAYRTSVLSFADEWRDFFLPMVFQDKPFTKEMLDQLPQFEFDKSNVDSPVLMNSIILLGIIALLMFISFGVKRKSEMQSIMYG